MTRTIVTLEGCDGSTRVELEDFTAEEIAAIRKLAELVGPVAGCEPGMSITELKGNDDD
ncbi:hypothetical protein [Pseudomonas sp.]|uniref:hypothetical protein n=1 Tax=Pseudomonas sp. TaxID=306 RepID=UPI00262FCCCA|nr:hypothetical protein [Pseudomonas sp.]